MQDTLLARMFFKAGSNIHIETRPVDWLSFSTHEDLADAFADENRKEFLSNIEHRVKNGNDVYIGITDNLLGVQFFRGTFTNVRESGRKHSQPPRSA